MTEKQYTIVNMGLDGQYIKENGKIMTIERVVDLLNENEQLKKQLDSEHTMLDNAILLERTRMGKNSLIQYKEAIQ